MVETDDSFTNELFESHLENKTHTEEHSCLLMTDNNAPTIKVYKLRWIVLIIYSLTAFSNTLVWLSLFAVSDVTSAFYNVNVSMFLWSSNAYTFMQVLIAIPASFLPSKLGLRTTMIVAASVNAIGSCVMIAGTQRRGFLFFVAGQTVIAVSASILPQLAPEVSAVWFPQNEHALSTSIGIILGNAGAAIGFLQPGLLLKNKDVKKDIEFVEEKLKVLIYSQAALCVFLLICVILFFKNKPKHPPTMAQAIRNGPNTFSFAEFKSNFQKLLKNRNYHLCSNSYALNNVLLIVVPLILNSIMSWKFPHSNESIGWMGFAGIIIGIVGSVIFGYIQDSTQAYKVTSMSLSVLSLLFWVAFTELLAQWDSLITVFVCFVIVLFFFIPFGPVVVDIICEITYPVPESTAFVVPITMSRLYSIPLVFLLGWLVDQNKYHISCYVVAIVMFITVILLLFAKIDKRRHIAEGELPVANIM